MKTAIVIATLIIVVGCASQSTSREAEQDQAVWDFIVVQGLEEREEIRSTQRDGWSTISSRFIIFKTRRDSYLVEFSRVCRELEDSNRIVADQRYDANRIRARFDTIRGCRISKIYALSEADVNELEQLGEAPGSRN